MTNINLLQSAQAVNKIEKNKVLGKSFFIPTVVLIAAFAVLGGAKAYSYYLSGEKTKTDNQVQLAYGNLNGKNADRIVDFQERVKKSAEGMSSKEDYTNCLKELEALTVSGAKVGSLKYSPEAVELKVTADNFKTVARQVLSFKQSSCFKNLQLGETSRNDSGNILFTLKK